MCPQPYKPYLPTHNSPCGTIPNTVNSIECLSIRQILGACSMFNSFWSFNSRFLRCPHLSPGHQETHRFLLASCFMHNILCGENWTACFQAFPPLGQGCREVHAIYSVLMLLQHTHALLVTHNISFPPTIRELFSSKLTFTLVIRMSILFNDLLVWLTNMCI